MAHKVRTPAAGTARVLGNVCLAADTREYSAPALIIQRLSRRLGCSVEVAALVAELSGLGPREARR